MPADRFTVILGPKLLAWKMVIDKALVSGALAYRRELMKYPPQAANSTYRRTHGMGQTAYGSVDVTTVRPELELHVVEYGVYALQGTGIYGYKHEPIRPKKAKLLAWQATGHYKTVTGPRGGTKRAGKGDWIFAKEVKGYIWEGKLEKVKEAVVRGIKMGFRAELK